MAHEQSETVGERGRYQNVHGAATALSGKPLRRKHEYEEEEYADATNAVAAAFLRSRQEGEARDFVRGRRKDRLPGRRGPDTALTRGM